MLKAVCFDMFSTLADPGVAPEKAESDLIGIPHEKWSAAMWEDGLCRDRGLGNIRSLRGIIDRACENLSIPVDEAARQALVRVREERFRKMLTLMAPEIVDTVRKLKEMGLKIGLISNADVGDRLHWEDSPAQPYFDDSIWSCDVGLVKPDPAIYRLSLERLGVLPEEALFVGDGGSDELRGAKDVGLMTVCTEAISRRADPERAEILRYADHVISRFEDLIGIAEREMTGNG